MTANNINEYSQIHDSRPDPFTTTWTYDLYGGVSNKVDATGATILTYLYDADRRLTNRWSAAKGNTVYTYDPAGNLTLVHYDHSPQISMQYDDLNRLASMSDAVGNSAYTYDAAGQLLTEDGPWANDTVSHTNQNRLRIGLGVQRPSAADWSESYQYDAMRRMTNIITADGRFSYQYTNASPLVRKVSLPNSTFIVDMYDVKARLSGTYLESLTNYFDDCYTYYYDAADRRTNIVRVSSPTLGSKLALKYDAIGQLKEASAQEGGTNRLQEQFGYAYDKAGNLVYRTNNALVQTFLVPSLNQLTNIGRSGTHTLTGNTTTRATNVTVDGVAAVLYADYTYARAGMVPTNGQNTYTVVARDSSGAVDTTIAPSVMFNSPTFFHDQNGNLIREFRPVPWNAPNVFTNRMFEYDDENQLTAVMQTNNWRSEFVYDGKMRRRIKREFAWQGGGWVPTNEVRYVYDGNLVVQERNSNNVPLVTYTRGLDLGGAFKSVGGIGGLLARTDANGRAYYHADGSGNVTYMIDANGLMVAKYLYDPFGNLLGKWGTRADDNVYRFSSKEYHTQSALVYYLYRCYDPNLQRWINRDLIEERGG